MTNKAEYIAYCEGKNEVPIFHQPYWWDCVTKDWEVVKITVGNAIAYLPYQVEKKFGFSLVRNPHLTPYSGLLFTENNYNESQRQELFNKAINFLKKNSLVELDCNPQLCSGIPSQKNKTTFLLSLENPLENIFNNFKSSLRRQLRKAEKNLSVKEISDTNLFFEIYDDSLNKKSGANMVPKKVIESVFTLCKEKGIGHLFAAIDKDNNIHAATFYVADQQTAYYLLGGSRKKFLGSGAMGFLLWHCIQLAHTSGKNTFDFEGSEDAGVARFFSTFGGTKTSYPVLSAPTNKALKALLHLKNFFS